MREYIVFTLFVCLQWATPLRSAARGIPLDRTENPQERTVQHLMCSKFSTIVCSFRVSLSIQWEVSQDLGQRGGGVFIIFIIIRPIFLGVTGENLGNESS